MKDVPPSPQALLHQFWTKYNPRSPGKITSVFPRKLYSSVIPYSENSSPSSRNACQSYEAAKAKCIEMVRAAVAECDRTNTRFTDIEFDIESDLYLRKGDCLFGLVRPWDEQGDEPGFSSGEVRESLKTVIRSGVLGATTYTDLNQLGKLMSDSSGGKQYKKPVKPKSVHRLDWVFTSPQFTINGFSSADIKQGQIGDCWWLAAVATIAHRKDLMERICVARDEECGVYGFVFHKDGEWIPTVIDDNVYLKERDFAYYSDRYDSTGKKARKYREQNQTGAEALYFARCDNSNETWLPLMEKAYAKIHGDYHSLHGGWSSTAMEDLTGGVTTIIVSNSILRKNRLWSELLTTGSDSANFVFALSATSTAYEDTKNGLALGHEYSVIRAMEVTDEDGTRHRLVKIRNPWGERDNEGTGEWLGPWSDGSKEWTPHMVKQLNHKFGDDGTFWMSFQDVLENFKWIHRTRLFDKAWTVAQRWTSSPVSWITGYLKTKFVIQVQKSGMVVFVLSQLDSRYFRGLEGQYNFSMEFVLRAAGSTTPLCTVRHVHPRDKRSINCETYLEAGTYEIIPSIIAERDEDRETVEQVVKKWADKNPVKLRQVGQKYDTAHMKPGIKDEDEEAEKWIAARKAKKNQPQNDRVKEMEFAMMRMQEAMRGMKADLEQKLEEKTKEAKPKDEKDKTEESKDDKPKEEKSAEDKPKEEKQNEAATGTMDKEEDKRSVPVLERINTDNNSVQKSTRDGPPRPPPIRVEGLNQEETAPAELDDGRVKDEVKENSDASDSSSESESDSEDEDDSDNESEPDLDKQQHWNPVCVMGLRVYAEHNETSITVEEHKGEGQSLRGGQLSKAVEADKKNKKHKKKQSTVMTPIDTPI